MYVTYMYGLVLRMWNTWSLQCSFTKIKFGQIELCGMIKSKPRTIVRLRSRVPVHVGDVTLGLFAASL